jgi:hypothetical protein
MRNEMLTAFVGKNASAAGGAAGMVLLGVPLGVLVAAFLGAILSFYFRQGESEAKIPRIAFGVVAIAFAGAWVSLALPAIDALQIGATAARIDPSVRAGLCALVFQTGWNLGELWSRRKVEAAA